MYNSGLNKDYSGTIGGTSITLLEKTVFSKMGKKKDLEKKNLWKEIIIMEPFMKEKKMERENISFQMGLIIKDILEIQIIMVMGILI